LADTPADPSDNVPVATPDGSAEWLPALIARARQADGQPPFSDQSLVDLRTGARTLVAIDHDAAALVTVPSSTGSDSASVSHNSVNDSPTPFSPGEAEFVVHPDARGRGVGTALLERLLAEAPGELRIWAHGDHPAARALAASHSLEAIRELLHLRLNFDDGQVDVDAARDATSTSPSSPTSPGATPATTESATTASAVTVDTFRLGEDETEWLELNARAFASHPEQGRITRADLDELFAEDWFRADDFLLARKAGRIVGYCWLKVDDAGGEFYVVGIDPDAQGQGLGRQLTEAGLKRMSGRDIHRAHLYVEADNVAAVRLYRSLGFVDDSVDIQYRAKAR
jgi:mycothiol synthase